MIGVYVSMPDTTEAQYHAVDEKIQAAGGRSDGMLLHSCFGEGTGIAVFDVWESRAHFDTFAATLGPIITELGVSMPEPMFVEMIAFETP